MYGTKNISKSSKSANIEVWQVIVFGLFVYLFVFENSGSCTLPDNSTNVNNTLKDTETGKLQWSDSNKGGF